MEAGRRRIRHRRLTTRNLSTQGYCLTEAEIATAWLMSVGAPLAAGLTTAGLVLGGLLVAACITVTLTNLCIPSEMQAWWDRRTDRKEAIAT